MRESVVKRYITCYNKIILHTMNKLDPKVIIVLFIKNFLSTFYIIPVWFMGVFVLENVWTSDKNIFMKELIVLLFDGAGIIFFVLLILGCYYWAWLTFSNFSYELQQDGIHVYNGILLKKQVIIPYGSIESAELLVNPLIVRFLDLYTVKIRTRELLNTEGIFRKKQTQHISGLSSQAARALRAELLKYAHIQMAKKTFFDPVSGKYR